MQSLEHEESLWNCHGLNTVTYKAENPKKNSPLISGKYGLKNHFWPLESVFLMRKSEKKGPNSKRACCPIFKFFVVTREVIFPKMAPILDPVSFFWGFQPYKSLQIQIIYVASNNTKKVSWSMSFSLHIMGLNSFETNNHEI